MKRLILILPLLLAGCSWVNYDEQTKLQIAELQKQAEIAKIACNNLEVVNSKINNLKGYLGSEWNNITPPVVWTSDSKPISAGYICIIDWTSETEYREYAEDQVTFLDDCGAFQGIKWCFIVLSSNLFLFITWKNY
jgi:hypothetical protein